MNAPKRSRDAKGLSVYTNLARRRHLKKDARSRQRAEYLATLPKHPVKRLAYRLHPKRFFAYWFSREGAIMALKLAGVGLLLLTLLFGALFAYYRRELDAIRPDELARRVQTTVTTYTDRNGIVLWEDKGDGDYKLVVKSADISPYMKNATVAIEDKDFYQHSGISLTGIVRAAVNNFHGGSTQGGSTLTQQLVKQVFFADEAADRGFGGIPRKIKETILAIEVERMYTKDQILTLYLNESPYGGRRNGVESAAQTYFAKSAKDLTLAESALLASIPQQPGRYDPYNIEGHEALLNRQHTTLKYMAEQGKITGKEADEAKKVAVLDSLQPESDQFKGIKAPHFVQMVKGLLETDLGKATVGNGGLKVTTTLDIRAQNIVDKAVEDLFASALPRTAGFDNGAVTVVDSQTGQVLALRGSRDYNYPDYGAVNAAISFIQPGSSVKPLIYSGLFKQRTGENYGAGSILSDDPLPQSIYQTGDGKSVANFDNKFRGSIPIRSALAESRNIPAIKAMYINGRDATIDTIHDMGDKSYCTDGADAQVGLAAAIGGCGLKQVEHANTFATIARMGVYKPVASVLEVKNAEGQTIQKWKDEGKQVLDPQIPYMIADILSDDSARAPSFGRGASGLNVPGVKTGTKTGTSNLGTKSKDLWMMSFTPKAVTSIWVGNHVPQPMNNALSSIVGPTVNKIVGPLHKDIFQPDGTWKPGDWFTKPSGIQTLSVSGRSDMFPSWYNKNQIGVKEKVVFDKVSKKKATDCTPDSSKIEIELQKITDPITKKATYLSFDGYDATAEDDVHHCDDVKPFVTDISAKKQGNSYTITVSATKGTNPLQNIQVTVAGQSQEVAASDSDDYEVTFTPTCTGSQTVTAVANDTAGYSGTMTRSLSFTSNPSKPCS